MWLVEKIEVSGGFLPGLSVNIPPGLTCIIGARGSGKSTLAEAVRFALCGLSSAPKPCADLIQANLAGGRWSPLRLRLTVPTVTPLREPSSRTRFFSHPTAGRSTVSIWIEARFYLWTPIAASRSKRLRTKSSVRNAATCWTNSAAIRCGTFSCPWARARGRWRRMRIGSGPRKERSRT